MIILPPFLLIQYLDSIFHAFHLECDDDFYPARLLGVFQFILGSNTHMIYMCTYIDINLQYISWIYKHIYDICIFAHTYIELNKCISLT